MVIFSNCYAQEVAVYNLQFENQSLEQILKETSLATSYKFAYSESEVDTKRRGVFFLQQSVHRFYY